MAEETHRKQAQGERIRTARQAAGLTQYQLAVAIGTREHNIIRWEKGQHLIRDHEMLVRIAQATNVPVAQLLPPAKEVGEEAAA